VQDLVGKRFSRLLVLSLASNRLYGKRLWRCLCDCGKETLSPAGNLRSGDKKSCGCLLRETMPVRGRENLARSLLKRRGLRYAIRNTHPYLVRTYRNAMKRCYDTKSRHYQAYGGAGIFIWKIWHEPGNFIFAIEALLGPRPEGYSLDRINPHEGYFEWNVRWADNATQRMNTKRNVENYHSQSGEH
jgi:hypothetical protein